jgi:hypothetical protein
MIGRFQAVVQRCASSNNEHEVSSMTYPRNDFHARSGQNAFRARRIDDLGRAQDGGTVLAVSVMLNSILNGIESRERQLMASIQEVKGVLGNNS